MKLYSEPEGEPVYCAWFLLCVNQAGGTVSHPILGEVPTCDECVERLGLEYTATGSELVAEHRGVKP